MKDLIKVIAKAVLEDQNPENIAGLWDLWQEMNGTALQRTSLIYILKWETQDNYVFLDIPREIEIEDLVKYIKSYEGMWEVLGVINSYGLIGDIKRLWLLDIIPVSHLISVAKLVPQTIIKEYHRCVHMDPEYGPQIRRLLL